MTFDTDRLVSLMSRFRKLVSSGAPVDLSMNSSHSLFLLQNAAKSRFSSGSHEPASIFKRHRVERTDLKIRALTMVSSPSQGFFCKYFDESKAPKEGICVASRTANSRTNAYCVAHGAYACAKSI